jgi:hypothetical protein
MSSGGRLCVAIALLGGCAGPRPYPLAEPMWVDDDRIPFLPQPATAFSPMGWDAADNLAFRPVTQTFSVQLWREAVNVNAVDEVPDSSWFTNRIGRTPMSPADIARGPCVKPSPETAYPWTVTGAKQDGANPGFQVTDANGTRYLLKFDDANQPERATAADVVGSKFYHAAGLHVPCNRIVFFKADQLVVPPAASALPGKTITRARVDQLLALAPHSPDGTFRAIASEWLSGKPIGPWNYDGMRADDPNDVVHHEDRRELRGSRLLGAWLNHFDARSQNTLAMYIAVPGGNGYVEHYILDWGDTLGSIWDWDPISRRLGYTYYLDLGAATSDFITFGAVERPWDRAHYGPTGPTLAYFTDVDFDAATWKPGYPNPAFEAMTERDAAWMARIMSRFDDASIDTVVAQARFSSPVVTAELARVLKARRDRTLSRYLSVLSTLTAPTLEEAGGRPTVCLVDVAPGRGGNAEATAVAFLEGGSPAWLSTDGSGGKACAVLPATSQHYLVVDVRRPATSSPARVHLVRNATRWQVVGLERPERFEAPPSALRAKR